MKTNKGDQQSPQRSKDFFMLSVNWNSVCVSQIFSNDPDNLASANAFVLTFDFRKLHSFAGSEGIK